MPASDLSLKLVIKVGHLVDTGRKGVSTGDQFVDYGTLTTTRGKAAGNVVQTCSVAIVGKTEYDTCSGQLQLKVGLVSIATGGKEGNSPRSVYAITGGTGAYQSARGQMTTVAKSRTDIAVSLHITR